MYYEDTMIMDNETIANINNITDDLYCENCDRTFYNKNAHIKHMSEHRTCDIDGCKFNAHAKIIEKHIMMQHVTGLYKEINNKNTPEEIAKWLTDRKNKYPTAKNVQVKRKIEEQMWRRGERLVKNTKRFNNNNNSNNNNNKQFGGKLKTIINIYNIDNR